MTAFSKLDAFWLSLIAVCIGLTVPVQAGVNAHLGRILSNPLFAGLVSFIIGTTSMVLLLLANRTPWPTIGHFSQVPWWAWLGGVFGAFFIMGTLLIVPRLGAATTLGLIVTGQMFSSLLLDHYGLLNFPHHPISPMRIVGVILLIAGVFLIRKF